MIAFSISTLNLHTPPPPKLQHKSLPRSSKQIRRLEVPPSLSTTIGGAEIHTPHHPRQSQAHLQISQRLAHAASRSEEERRKSFVLSRLGTRGGIHSLKSIRGKRRGRSGKDGVRARGGEEVEFGFLEGGLALHAPGHEPVRIEDEGVGEVGGVVMECPQIDGDLVAFWDMLAAYGGA